MRSSFGSLVHEQISNLSNLNSQILGGSISGNQLSLNEKSVPAE